MAGGHQPVDNIDELLSKQWACISQMITEGKSDARTVSRILQRVIDREERVLEVLSLVRPVPWFHLSVRARKVLTRLGINRIGWLAQKTREELLEQRQCGQRTVCEIEALLRGLYGLRLGAVLHPHIVDILKEIDSEKK